MKQISYYTIENTERNCLNRSIFFFKNKLKIIE